MAQGMMVAQGMWRRPCLAGLQGIQPAGLAEKVAAAFREAIRDRALHVVRSLVFLAQARRTDHGLQPAPRLLGAAQRRCC